MPVKAMIDVVPLDHIVGDNDVSIKLFRDEDGEVGIEFAVEDTIVYLSPIDKWLSYMVYTILEESDRLLAREEPKPGWREKNDSRGVSGEST